ncbi:GH92 family glycosyl hydrolase [Devriesea agamarum]|uniref:GH92 family glycosyl hydrolase n=1 Tax=Devriesea agamarum TaxID=472569 RepID=UPI00155EE01A|nr:GH92 family glycosyl hydrolase [Devriesea agamarum]
MSKKLGSGPARTVNCLPRRGILSQAPWAWSGSGRAVLDVPCDGHVIRPGDHLVWHVFPVFHDDGVTQSWDAIGVSLDLTFDDGSTLLASAIDGDGAESEQRRITDQYGHGLSPTTALSVRTRWADQWNRVEIDLSALSGRRISGAELVVERTSSGFVDGVMISSVTSRRPRPTRPVEWVDTRRGTHSSDRFSRGNTFPAAAVPHGFTFVTPMTDAQSSRWLYSWAEHDIAPGVTPLGAIALNHQPSPWMGDRTALQFLPVPVLGDEVPVSDPGHRNLVFSHGDELARPDRYEVLTHEGVHIAVAPTDHGALLVAELKGLEATPHSGADGVTRSDGPHGADATAGSQRLGDASTGESTEPKPGLALVCDQIGDQGLLRIEPLPDGSGALLSGYVEGNPDALERVPRKFFVAVLDTPIRDHGLDSAGRGWVRVEGTRLSMRCAVSFISLDQAKHTLELELPHGISYDEVAHAAADAWDELLGRVRIGEGPTADFGPRTADRFMTHYGNLYRLFLYPNRASENAGTAQNPAWVYTSPFDELEREPDAERTGHVVASGQVMVNNGFWDTFRTCWPAYFLFTPDYAGELVDGFIEHFRQGGWMSRWSSPGYADCMVGTSSDIVIADALTHGVTSFDVTAGYDSALRNATSPSPVRETGRKGLHEALFLGWVPTTIHEGMSWSLENALNDYGIAVMSALLAASCCADDPRREEYEANTEWFGSRAANYVHLFDKRISFFQGRDRQGNFRTAPEVFDPARWGGDYTETNAWGMAFTAVHDIAGLASLYGGADGLEAQLDAFFATPETARADVRGSYDTVIHEMTEARDIREGMLGLSNQPAHHIPFLYLFTGSPHKTHRLVRSLADRLFTGSDLGMGYPGDEDNGEMSTWHTFAALGLYPLTPASGTFVLTTPLYEHAEVHLPGGQRIVIDATGVSEHNTYIRGIRLDGELWDRSWVPTSRLHSGVHIEFDLTDQPTEFGAAEDLRPPSMSALPASSGSGSRMASSTSGPLPLQDLLVRGARYDLSPGIERPWALIDDTSYTAAYLPGGASVTLHLTTPAAGRLYTVTCSPQGAVTAWRIEARQDDGSWVEIDHRHGVEFRWDRQTRAFALPEVARTRLFSAYRFVALTPGDIFQLEFLG